MGDVINITSTKQPSIAMVDRIEGQGSFIFCQCSGKMGMFNVVCNTDEKEIKIFSIMCPLCNAEIQSTDGVLLKIL